MGACVSRLASRDPGVVIRERRVARCASAVCAAAASLSLWGGAARAETVRESLQPWSEGWRDPFEYDKPPAVAPPVGVDVHPSKTPVADVPPVDVTAVSTAGIKPLTVEQVLAIAGQEARNAFAYIEMREFAAAEASARNGLAAVDRLGGDDRRAGRLPALDSAVEHLVRLQRTAAGLRRRAEIEREFASLGVRVDGVVWAGGDQRAAVALVGGKVLRVGGDTPDGKAQVVEIRDGEVVFLYKGITIGKKAAYLEAVAQPAAGPAKAP